MEKMIPEKAWLATGKKLGVLRVKMRAIHSHFSCNYLQQAGYNFNLSMAQCPGSTSLNLFSREAECVAARGGISPNDQATAMHGPITKLALFEN